MRTRASRKPSIASLDLQMEEQQRDLWCWAAVSVSVKHFYHPSFAVTQCDQAAAQINKDCCSNPADCDQEWSLYKALNGLGVFREDLKGPVSLDIIKREINERRPVGCLIEWQGGAGHFVCIDGFDDQLLSIQDPRYGHSRVPYQEFAVRYRSIGTWTHTYFTKP